MNEISVTKRYVRALFELSLEEGSAVDGVIAAKRVLADLQYFDSLLGEEDLGRFLVDPRESPAAKRTALQAVLPDELQDRTKDFVLWITERGRANLLPHVAREFERMLFEHEGIQQAEVTSTTRLDPETHAALQKQLETMTGKKVQLVSKTDPGILGGLRVQYGSTLFDGSLRRELEELRRSMLQTNMPAPAPMSQDDGSQD